MDAEDQESTTYVPDPRRTSLALVSGTWREVSVRAHSSWLPASRELWLQGTLLCTDAGYSQQGDRCLRSSIS